MTLNPKCDLCDVIIENTVGMMAVPLDLRDHDRSGWAHYECPRRAEGEK